MTPWRSRPPTAPPASWRCSLCETRRSSSTLRQSARSLEDLTRQVDCVRGLKTKLTHIGSTAREVSGALDLLRAGVLRSVKDLESQLAVVEAGAGTSLTA